MERIFVKPAPGLKIRDDVSKKLLPDEGKAVTQSSYWVRRLACGDVTLVETVKKEKPSEPKAEVKKSKGKEGDK